MNENNCITSKIAKKILENETFPKLTNNTKMKYFLYSSKYVYFKDKLVINFTDC